jgi:hypothetical protein
MKRMLAGSFLAATFAVGLGAQTTPPQTTPPSQPPMQESRDTSASKNITVTGCLKAGDSADSFMLSDLKWNKDTKGTGAVGTSGTGTPPAAIASATSLKVIPSGSTKLSEHVGHTVEVTGTIADKDKADRPSAAPADPAAARPSTSSAAPSLEVRSVKMVSATCTPQ